MNVSQSAQQHRQGDSDQPLHSSVAIGIRDVRKLYSSFTALEKINLEIADNEFFTLLGPSGCGKTTLLRLIAGFEYSSAGEIYLYDEEIEQLPPHKRPVNTVFQSYSLFPHMSVAENIGFGLKMLGWPEPRRLERIQQMISMVRLDEFVHRKPSQLSGGQQQRVALARAMAPRPKVLLLDEPLSALDLKLRQQMRSELKQLQRDTGITFVFVTHDQEEALSMSDRIAVMSAGNVQQVGTPAEIYETPQTRFVADFIGETNLMAATVVDTQGSHVIVRLATGDTIAVQSPEKLIADTQGAVSIRPERLRLVDRLHEVDRLPGDILGATFRDSVYLGTDHQYHVELANGAMLVVRAQNAQGAVDVPAPGQKVRVEIPRDAARFLRD
ncbi:MAG: ABC transporter ATP-binding protein [Granulosicoccus sp.]